MLFSLPSPVAKTGSSMSQVALETATKVSWKSFTKPALFLLGTYISVALLYECVSSRRRQRSDATSEWARYATKPAARGRAIAMILLRLIPFSIQERMCRSEQGKSKIRMESGVFVANSLMKLGPTYIKLAQIVSCQQHCLSPEWVEALERLQDRVPAKSGKEALDLAYEAMGSKEKFDYVFLSFDDKPLAAASLGQVHRAVLRSNNAHVAVKLQRPHLRAIYDRDMELLMKIGRMADIFISAFGGHGVGGVSQSWSNIFGRARDILYREIDYRSEAANAIRFANDFGIGLDGVSTISTSETLGGDKMESAASWLRTPYVYQDLSTEQVLIMEYVPSIKITDFEKLKEANVSEEDCQFLADCLARAYLRSFCTNRFFSTDPHPGNLGVELVPGRRPRLVVYDFGQACSLEEDQSEGILEVIEAIIAMDSDKCVTSFQKMGVLKSNANLAMVRAKVKDNFETGKIKVKRRKERRKASEDSTVPTPIVRYTSMERPSTDTSAPQDSDVVGFFTLPAEYAFVARALSQMDGVGRALDPNFDFISSAAPFIVEVKGARNFLKDEFEKWLLEVKKHVFWWEKHQAIIEST